jgi:hypothetical protein
LKAQLEEELEAVRQNLTAREKEAALAVEKLRLAESHIAARDDKIKVGSCFVLLTRPKGD